MEPAKDAETGREAPEPINAEEATDDPNAYVTGHKLVLLVACIALACFLVLIDTMVVSTAVPKITDEFKSLTDVGWYASAYQFDPISDSCFSAAPQPLAGEVYTYFRSKHSFLIFFAVFEIGSLLCATAVSSNMFIVGRAIAGLGGAGIINGALTIVSGSSPMEKRPALIGITMGVNQLGLIIGPLIGGAFTSYAITVLPYLHKYLDLLGFVLFAGSVLQLLLALQFGGVTFPWASSQVIGLFVGAFVTFVAWFFWNLRKGENALLPYSMISRRAVWSAGLYQAILLSALYGSTFYLPIYFQAINGASAILSGVYLLPSILPQLLFAGLSGFALGKVGYVIPFAIFATVLLSAANGLYSLLQPGSPTGWWVGFQVLGEVGSGAGLQVAIIATQAVTSSKELSSAMSFIVFCQSLGPAVILALCQLIFIHGLQTQLPIHAPNVDAAAVIQAGKTRFRSLVPSDNLHNVLVSYANAIDKVFYLLAGLTATSIIALWRMGWVDIRKKKPADEVTSENEKDNQNTDKAGLEGKGNFGGPPDGKDEDAAKSD
ncbi:major facilitator superfamily domain-containing protein [Xylaria sp. FL1777]|nr:major facilitator superfamily domain-containing protein [Xylaria sp. FL1777]